MHFKHLIFLLFIGFFANQNGFAQSVSKNLKKARWYADKGDFENAIKYYKDAIDLDSANFYANLEMGILLLDYVEQPEFAGKYLIRAKKILGDEIMPELIYEIAKYYHQTYNYTDAEKLYKEFEAYIELNKEGERIRKHVNKNLLDCGYAQNYHSKENDVSLVIENAGNEINTIFPEYVPVVLKDKNALIFTSRRGNFNTDEKIDYDEMTFFEDVFIASNKNGKYGAPIQFLQDRTNFTNVKNTLFHESVISLSHDGNTMFIYKGQRLWRSELSYGKWSAPVELNKTINSHYYQNHVCLSSDGKIMFYSAECKKPLTGLDIYYSVLDENGKWSEGKKISDNINTFFDEDSPFITKDGKTLFFASNGHPGFGGFDIYKSTFDGKNWSIPVNLGLPINSPSDDMYYTEYENELTGFFASSRCGGKGDLDIYSFKPFVKPLNQLITLDINLPDSIMLNEPTILQVKINGKTEVESNLHITWLVNDSVIGNENKLIYKFTNDNSKLTAKVYKADDDFVLKEIVVKTQNNLQTAIANNNIKNESISNVISETEMTLTKVYFDFDQSILNQNAIAALNNNITLLKSNNNIKIVIKSYCDAKGTTYYNQLLSAKRSKAVLNYLTKNGIPLKQIQLIENLGELNAIKYCDMNIDCTNEQNAPNRRVEFKVVK